jgi:hypothetical protein
LTCAVTVKLPIAQTPINATTASAAAVLTLIRPPSVPAWSLPQTMRWRKWENRRKSANRSEARSPDRVESRVSPATRRQ